MPPGLRKKEDFIVSDDDTPTYTFNSLGEAALTPSLTTKQMKESQQEPEKRHGTIHVLFRTTCLAIAAIYLLREIGLFGRHFFLAVFLVSCVIEESSPAVNNMLQYFFPIGLAASCYFNGQLPSVTQGIWFFPTVVWLIGVPMSMCLHRYFSHGAFTTSRPVQAVIGVVGCLAYQGGPLWWAAKHVRHHHHCDQPKDPHSVVQQGFFYAFVGWTMNPINLAERDTIYNNAAHFVPELQFLDKFHLAPATVLFSVLETANKYGYGTDRAFIAYSVLLPMLFCRLITLLFNVEYHPAHDPHRCKSVDNPRLLAVLVGEDQHDVHHKCPSKARRSQLDPPCELLRGYICCGVSFRDIFTIAHDVISSFPLQTG